MPGKCVVVRVAAVQMESRNGLVQANLDRATQLVSKAAQRGAKLILLPEFMPCGYVFTTSMWDGAEPKQGPTVRWLENTSRALNAWVGTSFLEADGQDFFNTFVLAGPDGREAGRVRKQTPAVFEAFFTKGATGSHVIETELGKVGVGICYENQLAYIPRIMHQESVDLLLMPHSAPTVMRTLLGDRRVKRYEDSLGKLAFQYAHLLGVPVIMTNKCGRWQSPLPGVPFHVEDSIFPGLSAIADSDGALKAQLGREEDVIVEDIVFDPSRKSNRKPKCHGRWAWKDVYGFPWLARTSCPVIEGFGHLWYAASAERRRRARDISSAHYGAANMNKWHHRVRSYFDLPQYACHLSSCSRQAEGWFEESGSVYSNARTTMFMSTCLSLQVIHNPPSLASHPGIAPRSPVYGTEGEWPMSPTTHLTPAHKML